MNNTTPTLVGVPDLAVALGVDQSTIHRRIAAGLYVPAAYLRRQPLFTADDLARLQRGEQQLPVGQESAS